MPEKVILYDLANQRNTSWSPNPWKTRIVLNYKQIPYKTEWVEYPDLRPTFEALGIPPNKPGSFADYSSPTVRLADGAYVMDSAVIVEKLEAQYPEPSMHLDAGLHEKVAEACSDVTMSAIPDIMNTIIYDWLQEPSRSWFVQNREKRLGMSLEEFEKKMGGEKCRQAVLAACVKLKDHLTTNKKDDGPFILGSEPSYGDFIAAGLFESLCRIDQSMYEEVVGYDESFKKLHEACKPWLKKYD